MNYSAIIIDDDNNRLNKLKATLESSSIKVFIAENLYELISKIYKYSVKILVFNPNLVWINVIEFITELKKLPELLLFDLDGTLAKTKEQIAYAAQATLKRFNYPIPSVDDVGRYIGNGINMMLVRSIFGKVDVSPDMLPADQMAKIREVLDHFR